MIKLGDLLKSKRQKLGLNIPQVSENTRIPRKLIEALEESNYDIFSSEVYLKGFLKNYAKFLGIDQQKAFAIYRREREKCKEQTLDDAQKPIRESKTIITPGKLVFIFTILIILTVATFIVIQVNKIVQPPILELIEPVEGLAPNELYTTINSDSINLAGKVEVGSKLLINGSEVTTNNLQEFRVDNYRLNPGSNEIYLIAESYYFSKTNQIKLTVMANIETEAPSENPEEEPDNEKLNEEISNEEEIMKIDIEAGPEEAWIVVTIDGETKLTDVVKSGDKYSFEAKESFTIYSPRPQMVKLQINEEEYTFSSQTTTIFKLINGSIVQE